MKNDQCKFTRIPIDTDNKSMCEVLCVKPDINNTCFFISMFKKKSTSVDEIDKKVKLQVLLLLPGLSLSIITYQVAHY